MTDQLSTEVLRTALRAGPDGGFGPVDVPAVIRRGRRRRRARRSATAVTALAAVTAIGVAVSMTGGAGTTRSVPPADDRTVTPTPGPRERHAALVTWADCLRAADIPGVTILGPAAGSDQISYLDDAGTPLPRDYRETNAEWGSAAESCASKVPALLPELEQQWDMIRAEGTSRTLAEYDRCLARHGMSRPVKQGRAEAVGCIWNPWDLDAEKILNCPPGELQGGLEGIRERGPWMDSPESAGELWLSQQSDRSKFAEVTTQPGDGKATLHVIDDDGNTTGIVYLLVQLRKGWRLQGENVCR